MRHWLWMLGCVAGTSGFASAQQIAIGGYAIPTIDADPFAIAAGPDGALWFADYLGNNIGRITTAGAFTMYSVPENGAGPMGITAGPDGAMWFTEYLWNKIGRITTAGIVTTYPLPAPGIYPDWITQGPDGALWFTERTSASGGGNQIGRITTDGVITQYTIPTAYADSRGITAGPDGALWFTEGAGKIGRITTVGVITEYPVPTAYAYPYGITAGPDGALWFTEYGASNIGRITIDGTLTQYSALPYPIGITTGPDGALWFGAASGLGRITTAGMVTSYPVPGAACGCYGVTTGPDGELWSTSPSSLVYEAVFVTANLSVSPATGPLRTKLTFIGSGFAPNEDVLIYTAGVGSAVLASATADASGALTATASAPTSRYGPRLFLGAGKNSGKLGAADFSTTAILVLSPTSGAPGSAVTASGYGFNNWQAVSIYWNSPHTLLGTARANANGAFTGTAALTFAVPVGASAGRNVVYAIGPTIVKAPFTVR